MFIDTRRAFSVFRHTNSFISQTQYLCLYLPLVLKC